MTSLVNSTTPITIPCWTQKPSIPQTQEVSTLSTLSRPLSALINKVVQIWTAFIGLFYYSTLKIDKTKHQGTLDEILDALASKSLEMPGRKSLIQDITRTQQMLSQSNQTMAALFDDDEKTIDFTKKEHTSIPSSAEEQDLKAFFTRCENWLDKKCKITDEREKKIVSDLIYYHFSQREIGNFATSIYDNLEFTINRGCKIHHLDYNIKVTKDSEKKITIQITSTVRTPIGFMDKYQKAIYMENPVKNPKSTHYLLPGSFHQLTFSLIKENGKLSLSVERNIVSYRKGKAS